MNVNGCLISSYTLTIVILCSTEELWASKGHFYTLTFLWENENIIHVNHFIPVYTPKDLNGYSSE